MKKAFRIFGGLISSPMFENIFHFTEEETMKLFSLGVLQTDTSVTVCVSCPVIKGIESRKIKDWIRLLRKKREKAWIKKNRLMYNNCKRLLQLADDCGGKIHNYFNTPCRRGNQIQFALEFGNRFGKSEFINGLKQLEVELGNCKF